MYDTLPVVRVVSNEPGHPDGFVEINESDFDPRRHVLFEPPAPPEPEDINAAKRGKKKE